MVAEQLKKSCGRTFHEICGINGPEKSLLNFGSGLEHGRLELFPPHCECWCWTMRIKVPRCGKRLWLTSLARTCCSPPVAGTTFFVLRRPLFWLFRGPVAQPSAVEVSQLLRPQSGTACRKQSVLHHLCRFSGSLWRRNCSHDHTRCNFVTNCTNTWLTVFLFRDLKVLGLMPR